MLQIKHLDGESKHTLSLYNSMRYDRINIKKSCMFLSSKRRICSPLFRVFLSHHQQQGYKYSKCQYFFFLSIPIIISYLEKWNIHTATGRRLLHETIHIHQKRPVQKKNKRRRRRRRRRRSALEQVSLKEKTWALEWVFPFGRERVTSFRKRTPYREGGKGV